jgi:hypothetical protein
MRQGSDLLGLLTGTAPPRKTLFGYHGRPGTRRFKAMVRQDHLKLIWLANGGHRLLFDLAADPHETLRSSFTSHAPVRSRSMSGQYVSGGNRSDLLQRRWSPGTTDASS